MSASCNHEWDAVFLTFRMTAFFDYKVKTPSLKILHGTIVVSKINEVQNLNNRKVKEKNNEKELRKNGINNSSGSNSNHRQ